MYLYDPRNAHAPLTTLSSGGHAAISSLNWQHCFINSTTPNASSSAGIAAARTNGERPSSSTHQAATRGSAAETVPPRPPNSSVTDRTPQVTASALLLERPLDLSVTPLPRPGGSSSATQAASSIGDATRRIPEPTSFSFSSSSERLSASAAALEDIRRRLPLVAGGAQSATLRRDIPAETGQFGRRGGSGKLPESSVDVSQQPSLSRQDRLCPSSEQPGSSPLRPRHIQGSVRPLSPNRLSGSALPSPSKLNHPASFVSSPKPSAAGGATQVQLDSTWRIPAVNQRREPGTEGNTNHLPPTAARDAPARSTRDVQEPHSSSPISTCSVDSVGPRTRTADEDDATVLGGKKEQTGITRDDLLALHLDMLNQFEVGDWHVRGRVVSFRSNNTAINVTRFPLAYSNFQVQRDHMTSLVKDLVAKNDGLAAELADLRAQFHELLVRRKDVDWL